MAHAQMNFSHTHGQFIKAKFGVKFNLLFCQEFIGNTISAVDFLAEDLDLFLDGGALQRIEEFEITGLITSSTTALARSTAPLPPSIQWRVTTAL